MRKIVLVLMISLCSLGVYSQKTPHAIGAHFGGSTIDLEYQYHFSNRNFLDATAGLFNLDEGFAAQVFYNWNIKQWSDWTPSFATWKFWGGFGGGLGIYDAEDKSGEFFLGPAATLGFGFTLRDIPLTFGLDYRPMVALRVGGGDGSCIIDKGFRNIGITLTYRF